MSYASAERKREYERQWYRTTGKQKRKDANKRWAVRTREIFKQFKQTLACEKCGENHIACLDFHHKDPKNKKFEVGHLAARLSLKRLKEEIEKCIVLCANCHRKVHYNILPVSIYGDVPVL